MTGRVKADRRAPGGVEVQATGFRVLGLAQDYPITPKEHGTAFLMEHRHLWLRSSRQRAALRVRSEVEQAIRDFFYQREFTLIDSPILTPAACEGTSTLFETDYFGDKAYLSQSGQLYLEPAAAALGKVYCFGPTFRAEKSKTRRHLMEFWMVEPEVAFLEFEGSASSPRSSSARSSAGCWSAAGRAQEPGARHREARGGRAALPAHHLYRGDRHPAAAGNPIQWGDDFGGRRGNPHRQPLRPAVDGHPLSDRHQGVLHAARPREPATVLGLDLSRPKATARSSAAASASTTPTCCAAHPPAQPAARDVPVVPGRAHLGTFPHTGFGMGLERSSPGSRPPPPARDDPVPAHAVKIPVTENPQAYHPREMAGRRRILRCGFSRRHGDSWPKRDAPTAVAPAGPWSWTGGLYPRRGCRTRRFTMTSASSLERMPPPSGSSLERMYTACPGCYAESQISRGRENPRQEGGAEGCRVR